MTILTDEQILQKVKTALGVGGTYQDDTLMIYIDEAKDYLKSAGITETVVNSQKAIGVICRGVTDLWCYGAGEGKLSDYFMQRACQLAMYCIDGDNEDTPETPEIPQDAFLLSSGEPFVLSDGSILIFSI